MPVDPDASPSDQAYQALTFAAGREWLIFKYVTAGGPRTREYVIEKVVTTQPEETIERRLRIEQVLPYVTGLADARASGYLFPQREEPPTP
jgi:hypothetical protein